MKFEKPIINISMFDMENVVTTASMTDALNSANGYVDEKINSIGSDKAAKITITF